MACFGWLIIWQIYKYTSLFLTITWDLFVIGIYDDTLLFLLHTQKSTFDSQIHLKESSKDGHKYTLFANFIALHT